MSADVKLGRIWGIPIGLHISWFLIFFLVTWSLATGYFPFEYGRLPVAAYWGLAAVTSLLFFASVLAHELGHSYVALRHGIPVRSVTLFIFGGVAQIGQEPPTAGAEFRIAIAGPLTSLALAAVFGLVHLFDQAVPYLAAPSLYLMRINLILGLFNLIPGFPLDGGRVLRAAVWAISGSYYRATQVAGSVGQLVAIGFIGFGILTILVGNFFNGLWLVLIGWFLQNAAASSYAQAHMQQSLKGVRVGQIMNRACSPVPGQLSVQQLVEDRILGSGQRCFFVADGGRLRGLLSLRDITGLPRNEWDRMTLEQVMVPWDRLVRVTPNTELLSALKLMDDSNVAQLPVVEGDEIAGILTREDILRYIRLRSELGI